MLAILVLLFSALFITPISYARTPLETTTISPLEQAKQDYAFQTTKYQETREKYLAAKNNYMAFKTAVSKNEAFIQTQQYLIQVHNVYITYLFVADERSNLYDWGTTSFNKDEQHKLIQDEVKSLEILKEEATKLTTLEETVAHSQKLKSQVSKKTLPIAYKLLVRTDLAQLLELEYLFGQNAQKIDEYATENIPENDRALLLAWQVEVTKTKNRIRLALTPKSAEVEALSPNLSFKLNKLDYEFTTTPERRLFSPTVNLLREILNLI